MTLTRAKGSMPSVPELSVGQRGEGAALGAHREGEATTAPAEKPSEAGPAGAEENALLPFPLSQGEWHVGLKKQREEL